MPASLDLVHGRQPAYARRLVELRLAGERPTEFVIVTDSWAIARYASAVLDVYAVVCDPPDRAFDLACVHDLDVLAVHLDPEPPPWLRRLRHHKPRALSVLAAIEFVVLARSGLNEILAARG